MSERDNHFAGFAKLQMPELDSLFILLYQAYARGDTAKRDEYSQRIQTFLAQCAYDLVLHSFQKYWISHNPEWDVQRTPDLTEWPEEQKE